MLERVADSIHNQPDPSRSSMNRFVTAVGVSYVPLHEEAVKTAQAMGEVSLSAAKGALPSALEAIQRAKEKGQLGFKRKAVRC